MNRTPEQILNALTLEQKLAFTDASLLKTLEPGWFRILCGGLEARVYAR